METAEIWSRVSLRIVAPQLGLDEISRRLQTPPKCRSNRSEEKMRARGMWYIVSEIESNRPLIEHIKKMTTFIEEHLAAIKELAKVGYADMACAFATSRGYGSVGIGAGDLAILG